MTAITNRLPAVTVEYDGAKGKRATKTFEDANKAKAFYAEKQKAGKNPKVVGEAMPAAQAASPDTPTQVPAAATAAPATAKQPKTPGVSANARTRAYYAGLVIKRHGHAAGVTPAMVAEVDAAYGKPNQVESEICLRNAWHVLRAWMSTEE